MSPAARTLLAQWSPRRGGARLARGGAPRQAAHGFAPRRRRHLEWGGPLEARSPLPTPARLRAPHRPPRPSTRWVWALALLGAMGAPRAARAEPCETAGVTVEGSCVDAVTLAFCDEVRDEAVVAPCPDGEICAELVDRPGFYLCVDPAQTPCADIPLGGKCTTDNATLFCHEGRAVLTPCPDGTICALNADTLTPECVSEVLYEDAGSGTPRRGEDAGPGWDEEDVTAGAASDGALSGSSDVGPEVGPAGHPTRPGALPAVDKGPAYTAQGGGAAGCGAGPRGAPAPPPWALLVTALGWAWLRGRGAAS